MNTRYLFPALSARFLLCFCTAALWSSQALVAGGLDSWHWRNPLPTGNTLRSVAYGAGTFVSVGEAGTILNSGDGLLWSDLKRLTSNSLNRVVFANSLFVAVGERGTILTSADGLNWTVRDSGITNHLLTVAYGNSIYLAVGANGTILKSADGLQWDQTASGMSADLNWITFGNALFVLPGPGAAVSISSDGITWATKPMPAWTANVQQVAFGGGRFLAYADRTDSYLPDPFYFVSTDGAVWQPLTNVWSSWAPPRWPTYQPAHGFLTYVNGRFLEAGSFYVSSSNGYLIGVTLSDTGLSWSPTVFDLWQPSSFPPLFPLRDAAYGSGSYVIVGDDGMVMTSPDGTAWKAAAGFRGRLTRVTFGNGVCVGVGGGVPMWSLDVPSRNLAGYPAPILVSSNGSAFTVASSTVTQMLSSVAYGSNAFVAVGQSGALQRSTNGYTWVGRPSGTLSDLTSVCYGSNLWVAVGGDGTVITSPNGLTWTARNSGTRYPLYGVVCAYGQYVAVGLFGTVITSPDGIDWTVQFVEPIDPLFSVTAGNGMFVAVGPGTVVTSADGVTWDSQFPGTSDFLYGVAFGQGQFVAVGAPQTWQIPTKRNVLLHSTDGKTWEDLTSNLPTSWGLYGIAFANASFWLSGESGAILQSGPLANQMFLTGTMLKDVGHYELTVLGGEGQAYRIQARSNLNSATWVDQVVVTNGQPSFTWVDTNTTPSGARFYRLSQ